MPQRYHFSQNPRIAPLWIVPRVGWAIAPKSEFDVKGGEIYHPRGLHGYDHEDALMRAIFIARGPAFPQTEGNMVAPFQNVEVYGILCDSLGLEPRRNNGTIRLPFEVTGSHNLEAAEEEGWEIGSDGLLPGDEIPPAASADVVASMGESVAVDSGAAVVTSTPESADGDAKVSSSTTTSWLDWANGKFDAVKSWVTDVFGGHKVKSPS